MKKYLLIIILFFSFNVKTTDSQSVINSFIYNGSEKHCAILLGCIAAYNLPNNDIQESLQEANLNKNRANYFAQIFLFKVVSAGLVGTSSYIGLKIAKNIYNIVL